MAKQSNDLEEPARELMRGFEVLTREYLVPQASAKLSRSETALLTFLSEKGQATMSEISELLGLALSSTTGLVDRLVERRIVERSRAEHDRRTIRVVLTKRGRRALDAYDADRINLGRGMLERLDEKERVTLLTLVRKMTDR